MRVGILGPLEVERDGRLIEVGGTRLRALLAALALDAGRPVTAGRLADAVWDGGRPADEAHALQSLVSRLRGRLGDPELVAAAPGGGYRLAVAADAVDAERFERLAADGAAALRAGDHARAADVLRAALALWRGPALVDVPGHHFAVAAAAALDARRVTALADRIEADLALGAGGRVVGELEALVAAHPLNERLAGQLITALFRAGRQADALAAYERVRARLADELGVVPSPALQAAHMAVLQAEAPAAPAPAPPAPAPPDPAPPARLRRRTNLPAPVSSFVGREADIARIDDLLRSGRLVTLIGPGGAGKTRLAAEAAAAWVDRVGDGVWMVELAPVSDAVEIVPAVIGALGLRDTAILDRAVTRTPRDGLERLVDVLADREVIVILDNCEHLVADVAVLAAELLAQCPRLRIVATSREPLAIGGESLAPLGALGLPAADATPEEAIEHPAVRLFADRAAAVRPGFAVDAATTGAVVEICRRLDGLPLAIELAAARLRTMDLAQIAARLDDRFRLLTAGSRTALPRHRTLRAVVDWSWELLPEPERRLARRLAVLAAGATPQSAAAVAADPDGPDPDVLDELAGLVDRSLLQVVAGTDPPRYRMLETIREYGLERLEEAGETTAVRDAHARFFAALVATAEPRLRGPDQAAWLRVLDDERENVLAALRWMGERRDSAGALALSVRLLWFWLLSGSSEEARAWFAFALAVEGEADPADRLIAEVVQILIGLAEEDDPGPPGAIREHIGPRFDALMSLDDDRVVVAVAKPFLAMFSGEEEEAERRADAALRHPDPWVGAAVLLGRGAKTANDGDSAASGEHLAAARAAFEAIGDRWGAALALTLEAGRSMVLGDLDAADRAAAEGLAGMAELTAPTATWVLELSMVEIAVRRGDLDGARARAERLRDHHDLGGADRLFAQAALIHIALIDGDLDAARAAAAEVRRRLDSEEIGLGHNRAVGEAAMAAVDVAAGDVRAAAAGVAAAYATAIASNDMPIVALVGVVIAATAFLDGDAAAAAELLGAADVLRGGPDPANPELIALKARLVAALGEAPYGAAYAAGQALSRPEAVARLEPRRSRTAVVGA